MARKLTIELPVFWGRHGTLYVEDGRGGILDALGSIERRDGHWYAYAVRTDDEDGDWILLGTRRTREAAKRLVERHTLAKDHA